MAVQLGLCQTWSETPKTGFLTSRLTCFQSILQQQQHFQRHPAPVPIIISTVKMETASAQRKNVMDLTTVGTTVMSGTVDPRPQVLGGLKLLGCVMTTSSNVRIKSVFPCRRDVILGMIVETTVMSGTVDQQPQVLGGQRLAPVTVTSSSVVMEIVFTTGINVMALMTVGTTRMR